MLEKIKNDLLKARKNKESNKSKLLTTIVSDIENLVRDNKKKSIDELSLSVLQKFVKGINEILKHDPSNENALNELNVIDEYMPKQLSKDKLKDIVDQFIRSNENVNMGMIMGFLKMNYNGQYDGKLASQIVKEFL